MDQNCINDYSAYFACKIASLDKEYILQAEIGSSCAEDTLEKMLVAIAYLDVLCSIDIENDDCLTEAEVCEIVDKLKIILSNENDCGC